MGSLWGETAPTTQYAATIYAEIVLAAGARCRSMPRRTSAQ
jgi:hypothetical protein